MPSIERQPELAFPDGSLLEHPVWTAWTVKEELRTDPIFTAMPEKPKGIRQRIKPEAWTAALATDATSIVVLPLVQGLIALNTHTELDITNPKLAAAAALTAISLLADWYALRKKGWDISIVGCITQAISNRPSFSAITEHAINYIGPFNIVNIGAIVTGIATGKFMFPFLVDNITSAPFVLAPWYIVMNTLIGHGQADRVLKPIGKIEDATWGRIKQTIKK